MDEKQFLNDRLVMVKQAQSARLCSDFPPFALKHVHHCLTAVLITHWSSWSCATRMHSHSLSAALIWCWIIFSCVAGQT